MTASELYAIANNSKCNGKEQCHWCSAPCEQTWRHDGPPPIPFIRNMDGAKRPSSLYICAGCWLWRRRRVTVLFPDKTFKDGQCPMFHSWFITDSIVQAILPRHYRELYKTLLNPPLRFVLSILDDPSMENKLHQLHVNDHSIIKSDTELFFSINNVRFTYTIYDLQEAIQKGNASGRYPGVREAINLLGAPPAEFVKPPPEKGRPLKEEARKHRQVIRASGH